MTAEEYKITKRTTPLKVVEIFGKRVKEERRKKKISQDELASYVGTSEDTIKRIESGNCAKLDVAFNIAEFLGVPIQNLLPQQNLPQEELDEKFKTMKETLQSLLEKL